MSKSVVTMSLEEYNELFLKVSKYEGAIKVTKGYNDVPEVKLDLSVFKDVILKKSNDVEGDYIVTSTDKWWNNAYGVFEKVEEEKESDQ